MRRSILFVVPFVTACMGGADPTVLSGSFDPDDGPRDVITQPGEPVLGHERFAILLNDERVEGGVIAVEEDSRLSSAAQSHARDMVTNRYLSHTDLNGGRPGDRADAVGYNWNFIAENIARGFNTDSSVIAAWMNSPGHRDNMLDERAEDFGLGRINDTWVLMLGREFPEPD